MTRLNFLITLFILLASTVFLNAQVLSEFLFNEINPKQGQFCGLVLNGERFVNDDTPDGPLMISRNQKGKLTVCKIDRTTEDYTVREAVEFKIAIKYYATNALTMYSDKPYLEIDLQSVLRECNWGDRIYIITVDGKNQLPRHELVLNMDGC